MIYDNHAARDVPEQPIVSIREHSRSPLMPAFIGRSFVELYRHLGAQGSRRSASRSSSITRSDQMPSTPRSACRSPATSRRRSGSWPASCRPRPSPRRSTSVRTTRSARPTAPLTAGSASHGLEVVGPVRERYLNAPGTRRPAGGVADGHRDADRRAPSVAEVIAPIPLRRACRRTPTSARGGRLVAGGERGEVGLEELRVVAADELGQRLPHRLGIDHRPSRQERAECHDADQPVVAGGCGRAPCSGRSGSRHRRDWALPRSATRSRRATRPARGAVRTWPSTAG